MAVGVGAADGEGIFLREAEARGCFAGAGEAWGVGGMGVEEGEEGGCPVWRRLYQLRGRVDPKEGWGIGQDKTSEDC